MTNADTAAAPREPHARVAPLPARHTTVETVLGELTLTAEGDALTGVYFPGHWYPPSAESVGSRADAASDPVFADTAAQLTDYLAGRRDGFDLRTRTAGTLFQEQVWAVLREIPRGNTTSYGAIAGQLGGGAVAQAVGQAVGRNPISIVIPCHRVIGASGRLTGFAGGVERKSFLLELEEPESASAARLF